MNFPIQYQNGNAKVTIESDGTRTCEWPDGEELLYAMPVSADLKITQQCDLGDRYDAAGVLVSRSVTCQFCHEMSSNTGKHANLDKIWDIWKEALPGTEVAIGGGNPLEHPDLVTFLERLKSISVIPSLTVNIFHVRKFKDLIVKLQSEELIHGLGISYRGESTLDLLPADLNFKNVVFHVILGVHTYKDCSAIIRWCKSRSITPKILLLGYKQYGNGSAFYAAEKWLEAALTKWKKDIKLLLCKDGLVVSFDNLSLAQLGLQKLIPKDMWDELYQGPDGVGTMYCCAVTEQYAKTSTSLQRGSLLSLKKMFENVRSGGII